MDIFINGQSESINHQTDTLGKLLSSHSINAKHIIIEYNNTLLKASQLDQQISPGDQIEIIHFIGGGIK